MKTNLVIIIILLLVGNSYAQQKKVCQIKIETLKNQIVKGVFHQVRDSGVVVISKNDTSFVRLAEVKKLKVYEKGILIPSLLTGAGTMGLMSLVIGPMASAFIFIGIPVGLSVGFGVANIVATRKRYRDFQRLDKSLAKQELQIYAQIN